MPRQGKAGRRAGRRGTFQQAAGSRHKLVARHKLASRQVACRKTLRVAQNAPPSSAMHAGCVCVVGWSCTQEEEQLRHGWRQRILPAPGAFQNWETKRVM